MELSEAEVAADKAEKEAMVRSCLAVGVAISLPPFFPFLSIPPPPFSTNVCGFVWAIRADNTHLYPPSLPPSLTPSGQLKEGSALVAAAEKIIEETKHKMHLATTKRTSKDSLVEDVWEKNPTIKEEVGREGGREGERVGGIERCLNDAM